MVASTLLIVLLSLTGCATTSHSPPVVYRCEQPELTGETWADLAILAAKQRAAIEECNLRNSPYFANATVAPVPTPYDCRKTGVNVREHDKVTGVIKELYEYSGGTAQAACGLGNVGCAKPIGVHEWSIHFESKLWILQHEICHAIYEEYEHTDNYNKSRGMLE